MVHEYELVYILDPDLAEEALTGLMERISTLATSQNAEIKHQERWEKRRLAYEINKKREGTYVVMELRASPDAVSEMDRILKITEGVLRHLTVRADDAVKAKAASAATAPEAPAAQPEAATQQPDTTEPQVEVTAAQVEEPDVVPDVEAASDSEASDEASDTEESKSEESEGEEAGAEAES